jgi:hypothetical protein
MGAKRALLLIAEFIVLTVVLTWLWVVWAQEAYSAFFLRVSEPLLSLLRVTEVAESPAQKRFVNYVPFLVLMLITPGLSLRRRIGGLLLGFPLIFLCHVGLVAVEFLAYTEHRPTSDPFSTIFPAAVFTDAFPFILWAIIANHLVRDVLSRAFQGGSATKG